MVAAQHCVPSSGRDSTNEKFGTVEWLARKTRAHLEPNPN
jgi:hypothetical protein